MIGVTLFGVFLTPVFYFALMWLRERRQVRREQTPQFIPAANGTGNGRRGATSFVAAVSAPPPRAERRE
jgi:hypothetical protein